MILSGRDIAWYIAAGKLVLRPVQPEQFQQNGVDLILKDINIEWSDAGDSRYKGTALLPHQKTMGQGSAYLGVVQEYIEMPDDLMAFVHLRSTWARKGIIVPPTIIDAGFKGDITIEIVNFKHQPAPLGERFIHLIFAKLSSPSLPYNGKYQGQTGITSAIDDPAKETA